jgi:hypothetical protein
MSGIAIGAEMGVEIGAAGGLFGAAAGAVIGALVVLGATYLAAHVVQNANNKADTDLHSDATDQPCAECGQGASEKPEGPVDFDDPSTVEGKGPQEVKDAIPKDWSESPAKNGLGKRYANPNRPGDQIRVMDGNPADPNPVKRGPYVRVSRNGKVSEPIPLKGNPTLGSKSP